MPRFDGTGPLGKGPMTGRGAGFCILRVTKQNPDHPDGFVGLQGKPAEKPGEILKRLEQKVTNTPLSAGTDRVETRAVKKQKKIWFLMV